MAAAAATAVVHRNKRPSSVPDAVEDYHTAEAGEKRSRYCYETVKEVAYETVEEAYEFDSIDAYEILSDFAASSCGGGLARARDRCTGETVAVKRVRASEGDDGAASLCAVVREAGCLAACRGHPSVLQLKSVAADESTGDLFIVTEALPLVGGGGTLRSRLAARRGAFSETETRAIMRQLLGAAEAMHGAGVTHRDISPDNILLVGPGDGVLKLYGFGCATSSSSSTATRPGEPEPPMGAMLYRSPEQLYGGVPRYGPAEDMWALGCVMAELLAGSPLFSAASTEEDLLEQTIDLRDDIVTIGVEAFDGVLDQLSHAGRELLAGLLDFDSWERLAAADALKHRWFAEDDAGQTRVSWSA